MTQAAPAAFFSYCREDSDFALRLAGDLKAAGASVWLDQLDIVPGQRWDRPQLAPFEPILRRLCTLVFERGIEVSRNGWDLAQHKICELVIDYEQQVRKLRQELKESFRNRDRGGDRKEKATDCVC